jgi:acetylornithine deacetylase/succinyl-diaminopimelate desuccinylase-like protein
MVERRRPAPEGQPVTHGSLLEAEQNLLLELLEMPTVSPLDAGGAEPLPRLWDAQRAYARAAEALGFTTVHHDAPSPEEVIDDNVPRAVLHALADIPGFLGSQPNLVLRLGPSHPQAPTVMFNVHLDTVSPLEPVSFDGGTFRGRGAVDAKGPAVAVLAGVRTAAAVEHAIGTALTVLVQVVSGEEGGAMGTIGTRPLVRRGYVGRLNVFCEPTRLRYLSRSRAVATARVWVDGNGAVDDCPERGHNATVLLGFLAQYLAHALDEQTDPVCIAGVHTGHQHNRVYGAGELLINIPYASEEAGNDATLAVEAAVERGVAAFKRAFSGTRTLAVTARDAASITHLEWMKRGLPTLASHDPWCESLLEYGAGIRRWPDDEPAFTCDAIWMHDVPGAFTAVLGPGDLAANHAHAPGEFVELTDLERFATAVARVLISFGRNATGRPERSP